MTVKQQQTIKRYRKNATIILPWKSTAGKWELTDVLVRRVYLEQVSKAAERGT